MLDFNLQTRTINCPFYTRVVVNIKQTWWNMRNYLNKSQAILYKHESGNNRFTLSPLFLNHQNTTMQYVSIMQRHLGNQVNNDPEPGNTKRSSPPVPATVGHLISCPTCKTCQKTSPHSGGWTGTSGCCTLPQSPHPHPSRQHQKTSKIETHNVKCVEKKQYRKSNINSLVNIFQTN